MRNNFWGLIAVVALMPTGLRAEEPTFSPAYQSCSKKATATVDIMNCMAAEDEVQNKRLDKAYQSALKLLPGAWQTKLRDAQAAWSDYQKKECDMANVTGGTADMLNNASCILNKTAARAKELEGNLELWKLASPDPVSK